MCDDRLGLGTEENGHTLGPVTNGSADTREVATLVSKSRQRMAFENILQRIGSFNRYQIFQYFILCFSGWPTGLHTLSIIFLGADQDHWCDIPELRNLTYEQQKNIAIPEETNRDANVIFSKCRRFALNFTQYSYSDLINWNRSLMVDNMTSTVGCSAWTFDQSVFESTIVSQFDLVCDREWLTSMTQSVYFMGFLFGCSFFGAISDGFGRKVALLLTILTTILGGTVGAFMPNIYAWIGVRFVTGAGAGTIFAIAFVMVVEFTGLKYRVPVCVPYHWGFTIGMFTLPGLAYFIRNHITLQLILGIYPVIYLLTFWIADESPRWLISRDRIDKAETILRKMAKWNRRPLPADNKWLKEATEAEREAATKKKCTVFDLLRTPNLRKITLVIFLQWFTTSLLFYGLILMPTSFGANAFLTTALGGVASMSSYPICVFLMQKVGRRYTMGGFLFFGGLCLFSAIPLLNRPDLQPLTMALVMLAKCTFQGAFGTVYIFSAELFPTVARNIGVGTGSSFARAGALLSPQLARLEDLWRPLPLIIFGCMGVFTGVMNFFLPETLNKALPESLEDGENFGRRGKYHSSKEMLDTFDAETAVDDKTHAA
ncbi:organic cation transporter protein-like [Lineus longissimus]|uniref:organic cation transporter protein-like n=1 Tax=Lineus longissimus TaxID=88925 RepID=UPI002B4DCE8D